LRRSGASVFASGGGEGAEEAVRFSAGKQPLALFHADLYAYELRRLY
jgi:hypothetical protein